MQYRQDKYGKPLSVLGYGCMRFSRKGGSIDMEKTEKELLAAYRAGVNYFDTAYIYPGSEAALGEIVERNGIRERINIATKLPQYLIGSRNALDKYFDEELARLRTDYVDYYLMHHLTDIAMWEKLKGVGVLAWIEEKKRSGAIRNIGFSYHGNTENFLRILEDYDWDFCQIQYNYLDEVSQAGVAGLRAAAERGIPVIIMEPLRGGEKSHCRKGKGGLHRLPLLHALPGRCGYPRNLPLLQCHVYRWQECGALPVCADCGDDETVCLCHAVHRLRQVRAALPPASADS